MTAVMRGSTNEFDLPTLMQALSISRQYTGIEVSDERGAPVGTVVLKSGKVVSAETPRRQGLGALRELSRVGSDHHFFVFRTDLSDERDALGSVANLLLALLDGEPPEVPVSAQRVDQLDADELPADAHDLHQAE
jgi:hypothetical protein